MTENSRVTLGEDGKYRWTYSLNLFTNLTVFWIVWKIFMCILLGIFTVVMIADAVTYSDIYSERFFSNLKFFGYFVGGMTAISLISYYLYGAIMGGKYTVDFEMDEKGVLHSQTPAQAKKAGIIGAVTSALGGARGSLSTAGAGLNAQRTQLYSEFSKVRRIKCNRKKCIIKISSLFNHNQVYTAPEDFDFVKDHIISRCENAKK